MTIGITLYFIYGFEEETVKMKATRAWTNATSGMVTSEGTENWIYENSTLDIETVIGGKYESSTTIAVFITLGFIGKYNLLLHTIVKTILSLASKKQI